MVASPGSQPHTGPGGRGALRWMWLPWGAYYGDVGGAMGSGEFIDNSWLVNQCGFSMVNLSVVNGLVDILGGVINGY